MNLNLYENTPLVAKSQVVDRYFGDDLALCDTAKNIAYRLNPMGAKIWSLMHQPITIREIVDRLVRDYEIEEAQCRCDVINLLETMIESGLVSASA